MKVGSRKIYAVKKTDLARRKRPDPETSDTSDEDVPPPKRVNTMSLLKEVKANVVSIMAVNRQMKIPIAIRSWLLDIFTCHICQMSPIKPPVIFSKCCRYLIGCQPCVDSWYGGSPDKPCPRCRAQRGFAETCRLNGLDELLLAGDSTLGNEDESAE